MMMLFEMIPGNPPPDSTGYYWLDNVSVEEVKPVENTKVANEGYRFGFNGKENDNDIESGVQDYGMRIYDGRLGRFLSVDPITKKYPELTPYQFASNTPIQAIDLDGLEKVAVVTNSFAPFDWFGSDGFGSYKGDGNDRKFGGNERKYRISGSVSINLANSTNTGASAGKTLSLYHRWKTPQSLTPPPPDYYAQSPTHNDYSFFGDPVNKVSNVEMHLFGHDRAGNIDDIPIPASAIPNIDVKVNVKFQELSKYEFLVTGNVRGDKFPAAETYLIDEKGNKLFLGVSGAGANKDLGPYTLLCGNNNRTMSTFNLIISFNKDNTLKDVSLDGKSYTLSEWNKSFTRLDPQDSSASTSTDSGKVKSKSN